MATKPRGGDLDLDFFSLGSRRHCLPPLRGTHLTLQPGFRLLSDKGISKTELGFPEQNHTEGAPTAGLCKDRGGNSCWGKKMKTEGVGEKNEKEGKRGKGKRRKKA